MSYPVLSLNEFKALKVKSMARKAKIASNRALNAKLSDLRGIRKPKVRTKSQEDQACWDACSLAFRTYWKKNIGHLCFVCQKNEGTQAGHIISRRKRATKYDWRNLVLICQPCNWRDANEPGYHDYVVARFISNFGASLYSELVEKSRETCPHSAVRLREMREEFNRNLEGNK